MLYIRKKYKRMREKKEQTVNVVVFCRLWVGVKCFIGSTDGSLAIPLQLQGRVCLLQSSYSHTMHQQFQPLQRKARNVILATDKRQEIAVPDSVT